MGWTILALILCVIALCLNTTNFIDKVAQKNMEEAVFAFCLIILMLACCWFNVARINKHFNEDAAHAEVVDETN